MKLSEKALKSAKGLENLISLKLQAILKEITSDFYRYHSKALMTKKTNM